MGIAPCSDFMSFGAIGQPFFASAVAPLVPGQFAIGITRWAGAGCGALSASAAGAWAQADMPVNVINTAAAIINRFTDRSYWCMGNLTRAFSDVFGLQRQAVCTENLNPNVAMMKPTEDRL